MQRLKLRIEESGEKLSAAYAPPKWSETAGKGKKKYCKLGLEETRFQMLAKILKIKGLEGVKLIFA